MIALPNTTSAWFDVDDTFVLWSPTPEQIEKESIEIECPGFYVMIDGELKMSDPWKQRLVPHKVHIEQIKKHKMRGHLVNVMIPVCEIEFMKATNE